VALSEQNISQALYFENNFFRIEQLTMLFSAQKVLSWFRVSHFYIMMQNHQSNSNSIVLLRSDFASIFITPPSLIDSAPQTQFCSWLSASILYVYVRMDKQLSLLYGWHLLNVRQAKYIFSTMFLVRNIDCDVINALWQKAMIIWKSFLVCFDNEIKTTIYSK